MEALQWIKRISQWVWGPWMLVLLVGTGVFLTIRLKAYPWRNLGFALRAVFQRTKGRRGSGDISPFQSLMTALAATIGTGNLVGVATAMVLGGPGALVWMWISALFGLSTKFAESVLAVRYREKQPNGEMAGGPMYAMKNGFQRKKLGKALAFLFSLFAAAAAFGIGNMTQANSIAEALYASTGAEAYLVGLCLMVLSGCVLLGGIRSIGRVCGVVVPVMAVGYFAAGLAAIASRAAYLPAGLAEIIRMAFSAQSAAGGVGGTIVAHMGQAVQWGVARGVFSNEAGLGSAPIAAAAAQTDHPARQGYINMTGTFFDTLVVCTVTGLVIACSGVLGTVDAQGAPLMGAPLTIAAFEAALGPVGGWVVTGSIVLFAFSTILGWEYYGEKSLEYLSKSQRYNRVYRLIYCARAFVGATTPLQAVWGVSDIMNGLMILPNLICLLALHGEAARLCFEFEGKRKREAKRPKRKRESKRT